MSKKVVITGGNRGVGFALVSKFLAEGFQVIATFDGEFKSISKKYSSKFYTSRVGENRYER